MSNIKRRIWALEPKGISHSWLAERLHTTVTMVDRTARENIHEDAAIIRRPDVELFRDTVRIGDTFRVQMEVNKLDDKGFPVKTMTWKKGVVTIKEKYPFIAITDRGAVPWGWLLAMIMRA